MTNEFLIAELEYITLKWKIRSDFVSQKWSTAVKDTLELKGHPSRLDANHWLSNDDELAFHYQSLVDSMTTLKNNKADSRRSEKNFVTPKKHTRCAKADSGGLSG